MTDIGSRTQSPGAVSGTEPPLLRGIARGGGANLAGSLVTAGANFAVTYVVIRALSKAEAGVFFSTTSAFMLLVGIGQLGTNTGLVYFLQRCRAQGKQSDTQGYFRAAVKPVMIVATGMAVALFVLAPRFAEASSPGHVGQATSYLRAMALFLPFAGLANVTLSGTRGLGTMRPNALVELVGRPLLQLLLVALVVLTLGERLVGWAWAIGYVPAALVGWWWWRRLTPPAPSEPGATSHARDFWRFTTPRALTGVVQAASQRLDIVLVAVLAGPAAAAVYAAASRFIVVGQMGNNAISLAAQPTLAGALARGEHDEVNQIYQTSTAWLMGITWPLYLVLTVFGGQLLGLFGTGYDIAAPVLIILSLAMLLGTGFGMVDMVLAMAGHTTWNLVNAALALVVQLGLDFWLIPGHGVLGAAIGWAAAIVTRNTAALIQVAVTLRLHPFGRSTATCATINVLAFLVVPAVLRVVMGSTWSALIAACLAGGTVYLAGVWRFKATLRLDALRGVRNRRRVTAP